MGDRYLLPRERHRERKSSERLTLIHLLRQQLQAWNLRQILIPNHELIKGGLVSA